MSRVRVVLNYVDIAITIRDIKMANSFVEVHSKTKQLEEMLDKASKEEDAEFLTGRG